jgi:hypothetical protein
MMGLTARAEGLRSALFFCISRKVYIRLSLQTIMGREAIFLAMFIEAEE